MPLSRPEPASGDSATDLDDLRRRIAALERRPVAFDGVAERQATASWSLGVAPLDDALPAAGLAHDAVHEAAGAEHGDGPAAAAFLVALLARLTRRDGRETVLVCQSRAAAARFGRLYGPGWRDLGLDPVHILHVAVRRDADVLWAAEEGLRCGALAAVLADLDGADFTASRRLSLAAQEGLTPALVLRDDRLVPASAAASRWRIAALPGGADPFDERAPGLPRWALELVRCRGGRPMTCKVEWNRETCRFGLAATLADRPAAPVAARPWPGDAHARKAG